MGVKESVEFKGLVMRRVPDEVRENFKRLALEEFDNHYGVTLRAILYDYFEYQRVKELFLSGNLDLPKKETGDKEPRGLDGKQINIRRSK